MKSSFGFWGFFFLGLFFVFGSDFFSMLSLWHTYLFRASAEKFKLYHYQASPFLDRGKTGVINL